MRDLSNRDLCDRLLTELFGICRSLTGDGNRRSLAILSEIIPLNLREVACGTKAYGWTIPDEWNIQDAWIKDSSGKVILSFQDSNLCVVNYSEPIHKTVDFSELRQHLHTLPNLPNAIPYRTSYFNRTWGFCMTHDQFSTLDPNDTYELFIDSTLNPKGSLTYGDALLKGESLEEVLVSTYCCHPSMANDNLSGVVLTALLYRHLQSSPRYYSYRFVVAPETLGAIVYLSQNIDAIKRITCGTVVTNVGGPGKLGFKCSYLENHPIDRLAKRALVLSDSDYKQYPFVPDGSDERQFSSPGFRIPTISITKDKYYDYEQYHTSLDNLSFVTADQIMETFTIYERWFEELEMNRVYLRTEPHAEYQLSSCGLYPTLGGAQNQQANGDSTTTTPDINVEALSWLMFGCDGNTDLLSIAERSGISLPTLHTSAIQMKRANLLVEASQEEK